MAGDAASSTITVRRWLPAARPGGALKAGERRCGSGGVPPVAPASGARGAQATSMVAPSSVMRTAIRRPILFLGRYTRHGVDLTAWSPRIPGCLPEEQKHALQTQTRAHFEVTRVDVCVVVGA